MGANCSCLRGGPNDEKLQNNEIIYLGDKPTEGIQESEDNKITISSLIPLQCVIRGFLDRKFVDGLVRSTQEPVMQESLEIHEEIQKVSSGLDEPYGGVTVEKEIDLKPEEPLIQIEEARFSEEVSPKDPEIPLIDFEAVNRESEPRFSLEYHAQNLPAEPEISHHQAQVMAEPVPEEPFVLDFSKSQLTEMDLDSVPDYSNEITKQSMTSLEPFKYVNDPSDKTPRVRRGPIMLESHAIYIGEWNKDEQRHGQGVQLWPDGAKYEGNWKFDRANGKGRLIYSDGDVYEGDWIDDKAHGSGKYNHLNGASYVGEWFNDQKHGYGVEHWSDGACYSGDYVNGKKEGKGKFEWTDGSCYDGEFYDNEIEGYGTYNWSDGRTYEGTWKKNKMEGEGTFTWNDGRIYSGEYRNDNKHGYGVFTWADGRKYEGYWANGKQHGKGVYTTAQGNRREGDWKDGKRTLWNFSEYSNRLS